MVGDEEGIAGSRSTPVGSGPSVRLISQPKEARRKANKQQARYFSAGGHLCQSKLSMLAGSPRLHEATRRAHSVDSSAEAEDERMQNLQWQQ